MSLDETSQFHEELGVLQPLLHTHGLLYFAWLIPALAVVAAAAFVLLPFLLGLPSTSRNAFLLAAIVYLGGAIGAESLGGWDAEVTGFNNFTHSVIATAEEALEMLGVILAIRAQLSLLESSSGQALAAQRHQSVPPADHLRKMNIAPSAMSAKPTP